MDDEEKIASEEAVKQPENNEEKKLTGFQLHPELINKKGRPPKGWAWSDLLEDIGEQVEEKSKLKFKELVGKRLWVECANGNVHAIRELFNRMEGLPRMKIEHEGRIDTGSKEVAGLLQDLYGQLRAGNADNKKNS